MILISNRLHQINKKSLFLSVKNSHLVIDNQSPIRRSG